MGLFEKKPKVDTATKEEIEVQSRKITAQQWMPIADINNNLVYRKDNSVIGMLRIQPKNLNLLSDREQSRIVDAFSECLNGETEPLQLFCIGRPVDLNSYLGWLQDLAKSEPNFTRKRMLKISIQKASQMASSGETIERRFYLIVSKPYGVKVEVDIRSRLDDLISKLAKAELIASICNDDDLMDVLSLFSNPLQASFEQTVMSYDLPPLIER